MKISIIYDSEDDIPATIMVADGNNNLYLDMESISSINLDEDMNFDYKVCYRLK